MAEVHGRGVVHLDLKRDNIVLADGEPLVIDWGFSWFLDPKGRCTPRGVSTEGYGSPEQMAGNE
jgi:serine/threonine protein kinase